jgi:UDP-glucose 4-epimerase
VTGRNNFSGAKALVAGGLGFIGSNLARRLSAAGAKVTVVDNLLQNGGGNRFNLGEPTDVEVVIADIRDSGLMSKLIAGQDYLFSLAAQTGHLDSMNEPLDDLDINARAQLAILDIARKTNPRLKIVYTSTRQVYGKPETLPVSESHPIRPVDVNGINKLAGEWYHLLYHQVHGLRSCVLRLTNTYGKGMRVKDARQTFLGVWIRQLIEGVPIKVFGDGTQLRDLTHVDDCVDALLAAAASDDANGKVYNLGSAEVVSLKDLAKMMTELGFGGSFELAPFPPERKAIDIGDYYADYSLIQREIGWNPKVALRDGLRDTMQFYKMNRAHYWGETA